MSNYPPGVSGNEFAIAGPDYEHDTVEFCGDCEQRRTGVEQGYGYERWFVCDVCFNTTDLEPVDPDEAKAEARGWI